MIESVAAGAAAPAYLFPDWPAPPRVRAASTLRVGGVSAPPFDSFNLAAHVDDDPGAVAANRRRLGRDLDLPGEPVWLDQVHGRAVHVTDGGQRYGMAPQVVKGAGVTAPARGGREQETTVTP